MTRPESLLAVAVAELELLLEAEWELLPEAPARPVVILPLVILPASSGSNRMLACWLAMRRPSSWQCLQRPPLRRLRSPWFSSASWACRHLQPPLASAWSSPCSPRRWLRGSRRRSCPESARAESRRLRRLRSASWPCPVKRDERASSQRKSKGHRSGGNPLCVSLRQIIEPTFPRTSGCGEPRPHRLRNRLDLAESLSLGRPHCTRIGLNADLRHL